MGRPLCDSDSEGRSRRVKFSEIPLYGAYLIEPEPVVDARGSFARTWCAEEFRLHGLNSNLAQCSLSFNARRGTLRGMHYQDEPYAEAKSVTCCVGAIYDVLLDLRPVSPTYLRWFATELSAANHRMLYAPEGVAHGFQTLFDNCEVFYQVSQRYSPEHARGVRWDDPRFEIEWPIRNPILSPKDSAFAYFPS
jgi:dTDP-4-dehydrorhamnose 3,5-epimerase